MMVTETVPEPAPKLEDEDKPSVVKSPPPVVSVDQPKSELPAISPREARKLQQEEKLFEKIEQQQKRKETHKHPGRETDVQRVAESGSGRLTDQAKSQKRSKRRKRGTDNQARKGQTLTSIASEAKRRFSISEEQESKKGGKKAKLVNTQPAPEKIVAATALPPSQMVTPSRRLRTNTRTEPAAMEVDDHKPASSTPRVDLRAKGCDGAALKRQISQQEAAHVLAEMARNHSPPTTSSPLQLDTGSSQNAPLYPRISPTAETRGLSAMLCRLAVASGAVNQNDFNLPQGFPSAPVIKVPEVPPPAKQAKKISIAEYKSRRGTMTSDFGHLSVHAVYGPFVKSPREASSAGQATVLHTEHRGHVCVYRACRQPVSVNDGNC
ncbi:hypothetical protein AAVH_02717 [Aphelenchoides avenae]|nr:hypothetical protein AAVH_02717 [Aphelenchus avenae]